MGIISSVLLGVLGALGACLPKLLTDEIKAWLPYLIEQIILRAADRAPVRYRDRLVEEWRSHVNDTPGDFGKLFVAIGLLKAASVIRHVEFVEQNPTEFHEPTVDEILASIRRVMAEDQERPSPQSAEDWAIPGPSACPPICRASRDGKHHVPGAAVFPSGRYGGWTFQGPCIACHEWIDTGDQYPD